MLYFKQKTAYGIGVGVVGSEMCIVDSARATRRPRSSRIVAVSDASLAMANPMATARMGNQISSPMVHAMAGVQVVAEVTNASTRPTTEFGQAVGIGITPSVNFPDELARLIMPPDSFV